jgi:hypothetical protein
MDEQQRGALSAPWMSTKILVPPTLISSPATL